MQEGEEKKMFFNMWIYIQTRPKKYFWNRNPKPYTFLLSHSVIRESTLVEANKKVEKEIEAHKNLNPKFYSKLDFVPIVIPIL